MPGASGAILVARCTCGSVEFEAAGTPIASLACYCDDCQQGSGELDALANAKPVRGADGGTEYVVYRKDRVRCTKGAERLKSHKLKAASATNRTVAACCNAAMTMTFDDARHWVPLYRGRLQGDVPPLQWRMCTKFKPVTSDIPSDVPSYKMYPPGLMVRLLTSRIAMLLRR